VAIDPLETRSVLNFLKHLRPPVHVILLYGDLSELNNIGSWAKVERSEATPSQDTADRAYGSLLSLQKAVDGWVVNRIEREALSNPARLIEMERRIKKTRQPPKALCTYPLRHLVELEEGDFVDILSPHDHILFLRFMEGRRLMLEAVKEALESTLGSSGAEMIYRFAHYSGIKRREIPNEFRRFRCVLRNILGVGASFLERIIFRRLYLKLGSSSWVTV